MLMDEILSNSFWLIQIVDHMWTFRIVNRLIIGRSVVLQLWVQFIRFLFKLSRLRKNGSALSSEFIPIVSD